MYRALPRNGGSNHRASKGNHLNCEDTFCDIWIDLHNLFVLINQLASQIAKILVIFVKLKRKLTFSSEPITIAIHVAQEKISTRVLRQHDGTGTTK